ncbi:MAG: DUF3108 domain-containing protein [Gammaproteobacteria bacterium]|nr:DUF3108 domain-containing protein [Gammaproteobacteria bacterium]
MFILAIPGFLPTTVIAEYSDSPAQFSADYVARYGGFRASAERKLTKEDTDIIVLHSSIELKLLGQTLSTIRETSEITLNDENGQARPEYYEFLQTGLGGRSRQITFDWKQRSSIVHSDNQVINIPLEGSETDNLSAYLEIRRQLIAGKKDIIFPGIYKGELEEIHYRVRGEELVDTLPGTFNTLRLERIREPGSDRSTVIWLAPAWDYLLIKLIQEEPGSNTISLELKAAIVNDQPVFTPAEI